MDINFVPGVAVLKSPLKGSRAEVGSVIPGVTAVYRPFQAFAPEPSVAATRAARPAARFD